MKPESKKNPHKNYYWPPAGVPGVQRWLKFVKYLPDFDIQPIVYIPENSSSRKPAVAPERQAVKKPLQI